MNNNKYIVVEHGENGDDAVVEAFNYLGQGCEAEVRRLVAAAGAGGGGKHKPEFWKVAKAAVVKLMGR